MRTAVIVLVAAVALLDLFILLMPWLLRRRGVNLWWHTMFGPALVFDSQDDDGVDVRLLNVRGKYQSVAYVDPALRWKLACVYHKYFAQVVDIAGLVGDAAEAEAGDNASAVSVVAFEANAGAELEGGDHVADDAPSAPSTCPTAVVIGGGGYSFPKWLIAHCPRLSTTVVEIDPKITEIAREHFFLDELIQEFDCEQDGRLELVNADGWAWLRACDRSFDLIVNDAFSGKQPLGPLGTAEGAALIHEHLAPSGLYLANIIAPLEGKGSKHLQEVAAAFRAEFTYVWLIPEDEDEPTLTGDNVLVASDVPLDIARRYMV